MNLDLRYYLAIFWRRLPLFLAISGLIGGAAIYAAMTLPPAYVSQTQLVIEQSQIPDSMVGPVVEIPPEQQLEMFQARLLTRTNLLAIARKLNVIEGQAQMSADAIVEGMKSRTSIRRQSGRRQTSTTMSISFEARTPGIAAAVLNEYLTLILEQDTSTRTERASQTQDFFKQEVDRLGEDLDRISARILAFKTENSDALPDNLAYHRSQQAALQERIAQADRDVAALGEQRGRLVQVYEATGRVDSSGGTVLSPDQQELANLRRALSDALLVYSAENPQVKLLQRRIEQLETRIASTAPVVDAAAAPVDPARAMLDLQLAEIDGKIATLTEQRANDQAQLDQVNDSIARTPANALALDAMQRDYENLQGQYNTAVARLAQAAAGERIELMSRGEKVTVIEQPSVPSEPSKPDRPRLAALGAGLGIAAGLGLIVLLEMLNGTARRPADLIARLGVAPIATIPYLQTRGERLRQRASQLAMVLLVAVAVPAALMAVHRYYLPLDLLADRIMSKFGLRG